MARALTAFLLAVLFSALVLAEYDDTLKLSCEDNKTLEYREAYRKANNPCWGWLPTHTYNISKESNGEVRYISEMNVSWYTGLYYECPGNVQIQVSNSTGNWVTLRVVPTLAKTRWYNAQFSDVGAYRYVRVVDENCYVDSSRVNITFNETANIALNDSEIWFFVNESDGGLVPVMRPLKEGELLVINATVRNNGKRNATDFFVRFKDSEDPESAGGFSSEVFVARLGINESTNVTFFYRAQGRTRVVSFFADSKKSVKESDELDNYAYKLLEIEPPPPPDLTMYLLACVGIPIIFAVIIFGLLAWRAATYSYNKAATGACPRCGMRVNVLAKKCPVCGKQIRK